MRLFVPVFKEMCAGLGPLFLKVEKPARLNKDPVSITPISGLEYSFLKTNAFNAEGKIPDCFLPMPKLAWAGTNRPIQRMKTIARFSSCYTIDANVTNFSEVNLLQNRVQTLSYGILGYLLPDQKS